MPAQTETQKALNFTLEQGLKVQHDQLRDWQTVLKPEVFAKLQALATKDNHLAEDGFDVVRGTDLDNIIHNQLIRNQD